MKRKILSSLAMSALLAASAGELAKWKFDQKTDLKTGSCGFNADTDALSRRISTEVKTPNGDNTLELSLLTPPAIPVAHSRQVYLRYPAEIEKGETYRLLFYCRGTVPGVVTAQATQWNAPYRILGPGGGKEFKVRPEWQLFELQFRCSADFPPPFALPRLLIGFYPVGEKLYLGPVTLEKVEKKLPLALSTEWRYLRGRHPVNAVPSEAQSVRLENQAFVIAAGRPERPKSCATFYNRILAPEDGVMQCGMAADWYFECFLNGRKIYSTLEKGNDSPAIIPADHVFELPVKNGENLLAVHVYSGSKGWKLAAGPATPGKTVVITEGKAYRRVKPVDLAVQAGTALDFSALNGPRPDVEERGRLIVNSNGRLAFSSAPDVPVRFTAFNFVPANWRQKVDSWSKADVDHFADGVKNMGYNMIRIHAPGWFFLGWKIHDRPFKTLAEVGLPQKTEEIAWSRRSLDVFDYLVFSLKKRGIYLNLDISDGGLGYTMARNYSGRKGVKWNIFFDRRYRNYWRAIAGGLLTRVNPYTGKALKDDPVLALVNFMNEQDLILGNQEGMAQLKKGFLAQARERGETDPRYPDLSENALRAGDGKSREAGEFLISMMQEMTSWYATTVRGLGYPGLFSNWDMIIRTMEIPVRAQLPVIAQHIYFAHPWWEERKQKLGLPRRTYWAAATESDAVCDQGSSLDTFFFRSAAAARFLDRPYCITEHSQSAPNRFRHERGLFFGSYAALQGWDMLTAHSDMMVRNPDPIVWFDYASDPIARASEAISALVFLRGDVAEAKHSIAFPLKKETLFPGNYLAAIGEGYSKLSMLTKIGILYPEEKPLAPVGTARPDLEIIPTRFSPLRVYEWWVGISGSQHDGDTGKEIAKLRAHGILSAENRTDFQQNRYESETGELYLDARAEELIVTTRRLEGMILKGDHPVTGKALAIKRCSRPAALVLASLEKDHSLQQAKRLLLILSTNAFNNNMRFTSDTFRRCQDLGEFPVLIETAVIELEAATDHEVSPVVYALNLDGTRQERIPATVKAGRLRLRLDTAGLEYGTPFFEIIYP